MQQNRLQQLLNLLEASPNDSFLTFAIAKEYEKSGDDPSALTWYQKLKQTNPDYVGCYYHLAKLLERQEQFEEALEVYQTGMTTAKKLGDQHAFSELSNAKLNLELEEGL